ncbi:hypothetical protein XSR1_320024 [Xenorhabdus szentirmaii DSM 16338]|uniref:Uncharacterized protein n=1 Tax=Xenorhabdus szentirmaii DSM 16338 TaxID=1427518 RepID=W1J0F0_9GAMM|nr:hypothetical protein XSR1_320024 [Xenorhabdus szentirmaii DSM 16338]
MRFRLSLYFFAGENSEIKGHSRKQTGYGSEWDYLAMCLSFCSNGGLNEMRYH